MILIYKRFYFELKKSRRILMSQYKYEWYIGKMCNEDIIKECALLYSNNYGVWSDNNPNSLKGNVKLSASRIYDMLYRDDTNLYYAIDTQSNKIVGYAIALRKHINYHGTFSWVTQLVVHKEHRKKSIAKNLLFSIWGLSDDYAWGIITSNPYAVRALEKATRRRSVPLRIKKKIDKIIDIGSENINYISKDIEYIVDKKNSKFNTKFYVSHADIAEKMINVMSDETPWLLGELEEGWEWAAFTFKDQEQISLSANEINEMLNTSDDVVKLAYSRMEITGEQKWTKNTNKEVDLIIKKSHIKTGDTIIDFGCGMGRHSIALSELGYKVTAIDYVDNNVNFIKNKNKNIDARIEDCRYTTLKIKADVILCLYDVIGSFSDVNDNILILQNIYNHLKQGGFAFISVMNLELTNNIAKYKFNIKSNPNALLKLPASNIMESTGDVFNPDYFLMDESEHIVYRKEQFLSGRELPIELIVRDKRFTMNEIKQLCLDVGFKIESATYVSASDFNVSLNSTDPHAKEIFLICKK